MNDKTANGNQVARRLACSVPVLIAAALLVLPSAMARDDGDARSAERVQHDHHDEHGQHVHHKKHEHGGQRGPAQSCPGDLVEPFGAVDVFDLLALLSGWGSDGPGAELAEPLNVVDVFDLLVLLAGWGECPQPQRYETAIRDLPGMVGTDLGLQPVAFDGQINLLIGPPDNAGVRPVFAQRVSLATTSAPVVEFPQGAETGGITLQLHPGSGEGFWDTSTGQFQLPMQFDVSYWLIDQFIPPGEDVGDPTSGTATETWQGQLAGVATDLGDAVQIDGGLAAGVTSSITKKVFEVQAPGVVEIGAKQFENIPKCPEAQRCNRQEICVQPVFIGTGEDDADATGSSLDEFQAQAEAIWEKCCIEFDFQDPMYIDNDDYKEIEDFDQAAGRTERDNLRGEVDALGNDDCIEVFFVEEFTEADGDAHAGGDGVSLGGGTRAAKLIVADAAIDDCDPDSDRVLAHELGHALGIGPHTNGTCMEGTGDAPNCPGLNPDVVTQGLCGGLKHPDLSEKDPKEECCKNWDEDP